MKQHTLFLDTTYNMVIGILDADNTWIDYQCLLEKKSSALIHKQIDEIIKKNNLSKYNNENKNENNNESKNEIQRVVYLAGPGSYTGVRVGRGIAEVFSLLNRQIFSFYHFDVPEYLNVTKGIWFSKAFKGEFFLYQWDHQKNFINKSLQKKRDFLDYLDFLLKQNNQVTLDNRIRIFTHFIEETIEDIEDVITQPSNDCVIEETSSMIKMYSSQLLKIILQDNINKESYYYRSLEDEFRSFK
ncbi:MAG: hypothetical protein HQK49_02840 [Oligoflexia bacterium]|nr:hypothetical protein [Oligoflexia bacterium]